MCLGATGLMFFVAVIAIATVSTSICQMNKAARLTSEPKISRHAGEIGQKKNVEPDPLAGEGMVSVSECHWEHSLSRSKSAPRGLIEDLRGIGITQIVRYTFPAPQIMISSCFG